MYLLGKIIGITRIYDMKIGKNTKNSLYSASALAVIHCGATVLLTMIRARLVEIPWNQLKEK